VTHLPGEVGTGSGYRIDATPSIAAQIRVTENTPLGEGGSNGGMPGGWGAGE
jgi:hypothetical protein